MGKKRNCRLTPEERLIHERAVKVRKMTDKQIIEMINDSIKKGIEEGKQQRCDKCEKISQTNKFIDYLELKVGTGNGIGHGVIEKLRKELKLAICDDVFKEESIS